MPVAFDLLDAESIAAAARRAGDATLLINNASTAAFAGPLDAAPDAVDREMAVNYDGTYAAIRAFVPVLERNGGRIVNVLSLLSLASTPPMAGYSASKAAAHSLTQALRPVLAERGISVHGVYPAGIDTDMIAGIDAPKTPPAQVAAGCSTGSPPTRRTSSPTRTPRRWPRPGGATRRRSSARSPAPLRRDRRASASINPRHLLTRAVSRREGASVRGVIRSGIDCEDTLSARRQPRRTNGATGAEIMRTVAGVGGSHLNLGPVLARNGDQAEDVGRHRSGEHRDERTHGSRRRRLARTDHARGGTREADGYTVFRPYGTRGGLRDEFERLAADHPAITKLVTIGETHQGQDIVALKVTRRAARLRDGRRPAILYVGAQHAREWITPEMVRRLAHHVIDGYGSDRALTKLVDSTELWFVPVANPDGYDYSFTARQPIWRKNLRDNNRDGRVNVGDGVDLNRNFPTKWSYDDEGASAAPGQRDLPRAAPGLRARDPGARPPDAPGRVRVPDQLPLDGGRSCSMAPRGRSTPRRPTTSSTRRSRATTPRAPCPATTRTSWRTSASPTETSAEHAHVAHGTLAFVPEMSSCATASASDPADEWTPAECRSQFEFPDDEQLIAAEFAKNVPFALAVGAIDPRPGRPGLGRRPSDARVRGRRVRRVLRRPADRRRHRAPGPAPPAAQLPHRRRPHPPRAGDRVARRRALRRRGDVYYAEYRGKVRGARPGDRVEVWFSAAGAESDHFTYRQVSTAGADALIVANEDYTGVNPTYPAGTTAAQVRRRLRAPRSRPTASRTPPGTSTPRACPTRSACSATSTPSCGRAATTACPRSPRTCSPTRSCSARSRTSPWPSASSTSRSPCATTSTRAAS